MPKLAIAHQRQLSEGVPRPQVLLACGQAVPAIDGAPHLPPSHRCHRSENHHFMAYPKTFYTHHVAAIGAAAATADARTLQSWRIAQSEMLSHPRA